MKCHQYQWLAGNRTLLEVASMVVTWWIVAQCILFMLLVANNVLILTIASILTVLFIIVMVANIFEILSNVMNYIFDD